MAVGTNPLACYQGENVSWEFTFEDDNVTTISGWNIELVIKVSADALDPPLIGPITCSITSPTGPMTFLAELLVDVDPGGLVVSIRREDTGFKWQLVHAPLTVTDSASVD